MLKYSVFPELGFMSVSDGTVMSRYIMDVEKTPHLKYGVPYTWPEKIPERAGVGEIYTIKDCDDNFFLNSVYGLVKKSENRDFRHFEMEERGTLSLKEGKLSFRRRMGRAEKVEREVEAGAPLLHVSGAFESVMRIGDARERVKGEYESRNGLSLFYACVRGRKVDGKAKEALYSILFPSRRWIPEFNLPDYDLEFSGFWREITAPPSHVKAEEMWLFQIGEEGEKLRALEINSISYKDEHMEIIVRYRSMKDELSGIMTSLV